MSERRGQGGKSLLLGSRVAAATGTAEMVLDQLAGHRAPELPPHFQRMMEMEAGINPRPKNFVHQVPRVFEGVLMNAIREGLAIGKHMHAGGAEKAGDQLCNRSRDGSVSGRIFGMRRRGATRRRPGHVLGQAGAAAAGGNRGNGPPESVLVLGV